MTGITFDGSTHAGADQWQCLPAGEGDWPHVVPRRFLQASEQYLTCSQTFAHFFRQAKERLQIGQIFVGRFGFL